MERKKWTPREESTVEVLKFREKKKWQLALRRYVIEKNKSPLYAIYFGLNIEQFRKWIEIQFTESLSWQNFGLAWQFDHILPIGYFDFSDEDDLKLCWNFINIRIQHVDSEKSNENYIPVVAAKSYFTKLYDKTHYYICSKMIDRIIQIEKETIDSEPVIEAFIISNKGELDLMADFSNEEFNNLNLGASVENILLEREILRKFG